MTAMICQRRAETSDAGTPLPDRAFFAQALSIVREWQPGEWDGRVRAIVGTLVECEGLEAPIGAYCEILTRDRVVVAPARTHADELARHTAPPGASVVPCEVVGFRESVTLLMPLGGLSGVRVGAQVRLRHRADRIPCGEGCLGRVLDGLGRPIDGRGGLARVLWRPIEGEPVAAVSRARIRRPIESGLRAIDLFTTVGEGMRLGIFAGSGVGKSTLLGQLASQAEIDVAVIALVGERRREVREFLERDLGRALARSVVVVSTCDEPASMRTRAARAATAIAEGFRDEGRRVLLMMDSLTRFCTAQREIGLAAGEPPTTRGYTPSVWSHLPQLLERAGTCAGAGSITGLYTVLVEGDDMNEPVADAARSLLDGHIELLRRIAQKGRFPAIDVLSSVSRVMPDVTEAEHLSLARRAREALATYRDAEDLIAVGAYQEGADERIDRARRLEPALAGLLAQARDERSSMEPALTRLRELVEGVGR